MQGAQKLREHHFHCQKQTTLSKQYNMGVTSAIYLSIMLPRLKNKETKTCSTFETSVPPRNANT